MSDSEFEDPLLKVIFEDTEVEIDRDKELRLDLNVFLEMESLTAQLSQYSALYREQLKVAGTPAIVDYTLLVGARDIRNTAEKLRFVADCVLHSRLQWSNRDFLPMVQS